MPRLLPVLAIVAALALYLPSLRNGFVHDDEGQIVANPYIQSLRYVPRAFTSCSWEAYLGTCRHTANYYRPLLALSYLLTWALAPQPVSAAGYMVKFILGNAKQ